MERNFPSILSHLSYLVSMFSISCQVHVNDLVHLFTQFTCTNTSGILKMPTLNFVYNFVLLCNWLLLWSYRIPSCCFTLEERTQRRNWKSTGISLWFCELVVWGWFLVYSCAEVNISLSKAYLPRQHLQLAPANEHQVHPGKESLRLCF